MKPPVLKRIAHGDSAAMRECIDEYRRLVWSLARRLSRTPADAEDATQEIFIHIWQNAGRFDQSLGSEKTFIAMIARRRLIDRLRKVSIEPPMDPVEVLDSVAWSDPVISSETSFEAEQARRALLNLRPEQRQVIELGILHGLSHVEISARLNIPLGTVKSFMRRGLLRVREMMNAGLDPKHGLAEMADLFDVPAGSTDEIAPLPAPLAAPAADVFAGILDKPRKKAVSTFKRVVTLGAVD